MIKLFLYKIKIGASLSFFSLILLISFGFYWAHLHSQVETLQGRFASLNRFTVRSQEVGILLKEYPKDFEAFEACAFEKPHTLEIFQKSFPYPVEFGPPSSLDKDGLVSQDLSFSITCLQDHDIFTFVERLLIQGPGIFRIHEISITRLSPLTEEMLEKIATGQPIALFEGKITATWTHQ